MPKQPEKTAKPKVRRWLKEILWLTAIVIAVSVAMDVWRSRTIPSDPVPAVPLQSTLGESIDLVNLSSEKPVLVYFWGSWCQVCRFVSPSINWLNNSHDVVSVAVSSGDDRRINGYMNHHGYRFPVINDNRGQLMQAWGITALPTVAIIKNGKVQTVTTGFSSPPGLWLRMAVNKSKQ